MSLKPFCPEYKDILEEARALANFFETMKKESGNQPLLIGELVTQDVVGCLRALADQLEEAVKDKQ